MEYCSCYRVLTVEEATQHLLDELKELHDCEPGSATLDELSDVKYAVNRLAGAMFGMEYVPLVDGDQRHIKKMKRRMREHGCIRSKRHSCQKKEK